MANAGALKARFERIYDEKPARTVTGPLKPGQHLPGSPFGTTVADVKSVVIHETDGWPPRNRSGEFVRRYIDPASGGFYGIGPQFYVSSDGTIARIIGERQVTWHAEFLNMQSVGIENGHRDNRNAAGPATDSEPWHELSSDAEDAPGQKFYALLHRYDLPLEVVFSWFPTSTFAGPHGATGTEKGMLFTEWQYRSLASLVRYLAERMLVPRNFALFPWATRPGEIDNPAPRLRRIALADERFAAIADRLVARNFALTDFDVDNAPVFQTHYAATIIAPGTAATLPGFPYYAANTNKRLNMAWLDLFREFRGIHGHGFAGAVKNVYDDHATCPGPVFDWHRFAREVWDWWWYPFDFNDSFSATAATWRDYTATPAPDIDTPLVEYFFENTPPAPAPDPYTLRTVPPVTPPGGAGLLGSSSSPSTFRVDTATTVYAMANGELVAARLMAPAPGVSMSFALVRHDIHHAPELIGCAPVLDALLTLGVTPEPPPDIRSGRIDYDAPPTTVYSLYMHLGGTNRMNVDAITVGNPDWLNRVLMRRKECALAIDAGTGNLNPVLAAMPPADFTVPEPSWANRSNALDQMRMDQIAINNFLAPLRRGDVAVAPAPARRANAAPGPTPFNILLGDFLGTAGVIRVAPDGPWTGIGIEVFSPAVIAPLGASATLSVSEWARDLTAAEAAAARALGADPALMKWWATAAGDQSWDARLEPEAKLPLSGRVYHYPPLDFLRWINDVTWTSEWPKYQIKNGATLAPRPAKPRPRRVR